MDLTAKIRITCAIKTFMSTLITSNNMPPRAVVRILRNSLPRQLLCRRCPEPDRASPQNTLPALLSLNATEHQMLPHHREDLHGPEPGHRAIQMGRPVGPERAPRMAEARTAGSAVVAPSAVARLVFPVIVAHDDELQGPQRQPGLAG